MSINVCKNFNNAKVLLMSILGCFCVNNLSELTGHYDGVYGSTFSNHPSD